LIQLALTTGDGRIVPVRSVLVVFIRVGSQRTDIPNALKMVEPRILIDTTKLPVESAFIGGRFWGHTVESPGTIHTRPTNGGSPVKPKGALFARRGWSPLAKLLFELYPSMKPTDSPPKSSSARTRTATVSLPMSISPTGKLCWLHASLLPCQTNFLQALKEGENLDQMAIEVA
jgi:hypothetical protein